MQVKELDAVEQPASAGELNGSAAAVTAEQPAAPLDPLELEAIALNLEASLRIYTEHHFFSWTQGLLQNLIRHEVLVCCLRKGDADTSVVESFSTGHTESKLFSQLYRQDAALADKLIKEWEARHFQPVVHDAASELFANSSLLREFTRIGAGKVIAHGTYDTSGRMASFFLFACRADEAGPRQVRLVGMLVPFLHTAWVSTKINPPASSGDNSVHASSRDLLTVREQEVLKWVYLGKSNIEIGLILGISPLTVKNHVQEILRRLNVQNRTQAVGKAFDLHILSS